MRSPSAAPPLELDEDELLDEELVEEELLELELLELELDELELLDEPSPPTDPPQADNSIAVASVKTNLPLPPAWHERAAIPFRIAVTVIEIP